MYRNIESLSNKGDNKVVLARSLTTDELLVQKKVSLETASIYATISTIQNKHLPRVVEIITMRDHAVVVEEYLHGVTLEKKLEGQNIDEQTAVLWMKQICEALRPLHHADPPIIHRDIKPANIIITNDGYAKLIDFDASRVYKDGGSQDTRAVGTRGYAAPEQYGGAQTDARTDIYALGVLLSVMLGGSATGGTVESKGRLGRIIKRCTMFDPKDRYQNAKQLSKALEIIVKYPKRMVRMLASSLAIVAILAVLVGWRLSDRYAPGPDLPAEPSPTPISSTASPAAGIGHRQATPTPARSFTPVLAVEPTPTPTPSPTPKNKPTPSPTPQSTQSAAPSPSPSSTPQAEPTPSQTPTPTIAPTKTPAPTAQGFTARPLSSSDAAQRAIKGWIDVTGVSYGMSREQVLQIKGDSIEDNAIAYPGVSVIKSLKTGWYRMMFEFNQDRMHFISHFTIVNRAGLSTEQLTDMISAAQKEVVDQLGKPTRISATYDNQYDSPAQALLEGNEYVFLRHYWEINGYHVHLAVTRTGDGRDLLFTISIGHW